EAPGARLIVGGAGDEAYRAEIDALIARHNVGDRVEWLGFIDEVAKPGFFQRIDALAMPSAFECFGLVAAEALGAGVPVIVSPTVGVADMIADADCGIIVPPRADALAACLRSLGDGAQLARWRANARPTALRLFSFGAHGARLRDVYDTMVSARRP
ncbi:MAG: glycosyltransferase family 4 protein, partial [Proteobacteria bacterium]|nr:glycosyltransferase family 4 protein [Pseudomonadota bacterium]